MQRNKLKYKRLYHNHDILRIMMKELKLPYGRWDSVGAVTFH
jgi:hypothetical protein